MENKELVNDEKDKVDGKQTKVWKGNIEKS